jgi:hypothetical protein
MDEREILAIPRRSNWVKVTCVMPAEAFAIFDTARDRVARQYGINHPAEQVNNGLVLEVLAAEFIAS